MFVMYDAIEDLKPFMYIVVAIVCFVSYFASKDKEAQKKQEKEELKSMAKATWKQEMEILKGLKDANTRQELLNSISEELTEIYGESWKDEFEINSEADIESTYKDAYYPYGAAFHILLSKQGNIPMTSSDYYDLGVREFLISADAHAKKVDKLVKTCRIIEQNVQKEHWQLRMVFVPRAKITGNYKQGDSEDLAFGKIYWEHCIPEGSGNTATRRLW